MKRALKVFADFDGTITRADVGDAFYRTFGGPICDELVEQYRREEISAIECFRREAASMGRVKIDALNALIDTQEIDPTFGTLAAWCGAQGIPLLILSDGLDYYIGRILAREGLQNVRFVSNRVRFFEEAPDGTARIGVDFPHADAECDRCACCKRNIMLNEASESDVIAYVGEGYSDRCPARYADIVFAKDELQTYCQKENISYYPYASFAEVTDRLAALMSRPPLHLRSRAAAERRAAFIRES
ncbi:MAG TPA: MtnX-like HAD-IB family phosphatase [Bacteroidota bacterium]|nr:MtnX-like HAD-IB family phosphatase [Bacteroidota bacterium]